MRLHVESQSNCEFQDTTWWFSQLRWSIWSRLPAAMLFTVDSRFNCTSHDIGLHHIWQIGWISHMFFCKYTTWQQFQSECLTGFIKMQILDDHNGTSFEVSHDVMAHDHMHLDLKIQEDPTLGMKFERKKKSDSREDIEMRMLTRDWVLKQGSLKQGLMV